MWMLPFATACLALQVASGLPTDPAVGVGASSPPSFRVVDVTGDGLPDKLRFDADGTLTVSVGPLPSTQAPRVHKLAPLALAQLLVDDLNGDGSLDLYVVSQAKNVALLGDGTGWFQEATERLGLNDWGQGLTAERIDLDGRGPTELLLHNVDSDVIFWGRRGHFERDAEAPVSSGNATSGSVAANLAQAIGEIADSAGLMAIPMTDDAGGPIVVLAPADFGTDPDDSGSPDPTQKLHKFPLIPVGGLSATASGDLRVAGATPTDGIIPDSDAKLLLALSGIFVNDEEGEVGPGDILDGSLTGPDVSTASGDVYHVGGNVGIETTSPEVELHITDGGDVGTTGKLLVSGADSSSRAEVWLRQASDTGTVMGLRYDGSQFGIFKKDAVIDSTAADYLVVDQSSGRVGINTDDPQARLHVQGTGSEGTVMVSPGFGISNGNSNIFLAEHEDGDIGMRIRYDGGNNQLLVQGTTNGAFYSGPHLTIARDSGRVGVLTDSPNASLGVKATSGSSSIIRGMDTSDNTVFRVFDDGRTGVGTDSPNAAFGVQEVSASSNIMRGMTLAGDTVFRVTNTGRVITTALQITGGGDLVEGFDGGDTDCSPGTVVSIDTQNPGQVRPSTGAYDLCVAGVVSGAGGVHHGIRMGQDDVLDGDVLVAMTGRVWVRCTDEGGPIRPGDRLTTANLPGHAMAATEADRCDGAVLGKAMTALDGSSGLVLVLVNLQ